MIAGSRDGRRLRASVDEPRNLAAGFALAFTVTGAPIFLHLLSQPAAIVLCLTTAILIARYREEHAPVVVLTANIFQNSFVSLVSPFFDDLSQIEPLKAYNFITTIAIWATVATRFVSHRDSFSPLVRRMIYASVAVLCVVGVYFVLGLAINSRNAIIYLRNIGLPLLMFQLFLVIGTRNRVPLPAIMAVLLAVTVLCGYMELVFTDQWLTLTNGWTYNTLNAARRLLDVKQIQEDAREGRVITNVLDYSRSKFLNISLPGVLDFDVARLQGPNFHSISFGYALSTMIAFTIIDGVAVIGILAIPLLIATSAKGPMILLFGSAAISRLARRVGARPAVTALLVGLGAYSAFVFFSGKASGDYHVLGLIGGLNGFLHLPIGHTLGDGGNFSLPEFNIDWNKAQQEGATTLAVESAVGVLFFQLGVMAAVVIGFYAWVSGTAWRLFAATHAPALAFAGSACVILLVNGIFQEEAYFSPLSLPLLMAIVGLILGSADREIVARLPRAPRPDRPARGRVAWRRE